MRDIFLEPALYLDRPFERTDFFTAARFGAGFDFLTAFAFGFAINFAAGFAAGFEPRTALFLAGAFALFLAGAFALFLAGALAFCFELCRAFVGFADFFTAGFFAAPLRCAPIEM